jgi:oligopeptide transport system substrate-binding protein
MPVPAASDCRQASALHRQGGVLAREGGHPLLEQVPAGLLRRLRHQFRQLRPGRAVSVRGRGQPAGDGGEGHPLETVGRHRHALHGLQLLDPVVGGPARCGERESAQAAPGHLHRARLGGVHFHLRRTAAASRRRGRFRPASSAIRAARPASTEHVYDWADGAPKRKSDRRREALLAEAGYPDGRDAKSGQPLVLYLDTTDRGLGDKPRLDWYRKQFAGSIRWRSAAPTTTASRKRSARVRRRCSSGAGTPTTPIRRISCSCFHGRRARPRPRARTPPTTPMPNTTACSTHEAHGQRPARQAAHRPHDGHPARTRPGPSAYHPKDYGLDPRLGVQPQANDMANNGLKYRASTRRSAKPEARRMEPPGAVAARLVAVLLAAAPAPALAGWRRREQGEGAGA